MLWTFLFVVPHRRPTRYTFYAPQRALLCVKYIVEKSFSTALLSFTVFRHHNGSSLVTRSTALFSPLAEISKDFFAFFTSAQAFQKQIKAERYFSTLDYHEWSFDLLRTFPNTKHSHQLQFSFLWQIDKGFVESLRTLDSKVSHPQRKPISQRQVLIAFSGMFVAFSLHCSFLSSPTTHPTSLSNHTVEIVCNHRPYSSMHLESLFSCRDRKATHYLSTHLTSLISLLLFDQHICVLCTPGLPPRRPLASQFNINVYLFISKCIQNWNLRIHTELLIQDVQ